MRKKKIIQLNERVIQKIINILQTNPKVKEIILFGSRAKNTAKNGSDIDIALKGDNIEFIDLCILSSKIHELNLPYKVDIVNYNDITNQALKQHIDRVGVRL